MTRRRGRPRPDGISKNFGQRNYGLNFRSLKDSVRIATNKQDGHNDDNRSNHQMVTIAIVICQVTPTLKLFTN